jgi:septal ring factor EnvC (AmiA/AmiB activator)
MILLVLLLLAAPDAHAEARALINREAQLADGIEALDRRIGGLAIAQRDTQSQVDQAHRAVATVTQRADALALKIRTHRDLLARNLMQHRVLGERNWLRVLTTAADVGAVLRQRYALRQLVRRDLHAVERLHADEAQLAALRMERERAQSEFDAQRAELNAQRAAFEHQRAVRTEVLGALQRERRLQQRALAEQAARRAALDATLPQIGGAAPTGFAAERGHLPQPVPGAIRTPFGERRVSGLRTKIFSKGVTITAPQGTPARAVYAGRVAFADWYQGFGRLVIIDHGQNWFSLYAHLDTLAVQSKAMVEQGTELGAVGDSGALDGAGLYFEIRQQSAAKDPALWLRGAR